MRILRLKDVIEKNWLSPCHSLQVHSRRHLPKAHPLGGRSVGWVDSEVHDWILDAVHARDHQRSLTSHPDHRC